MGDQSDFFGSEILTKRDFLGSRKDRDFLGHEKKVIFWDCTFQQLKSAKR